MKYACRFAWIVFMIAGTASAGPVICERTATDLILSNDHTRLELDADNFTLQSMQSLKLNREFIHAPGGDLFTVVRLVPGETPPVWYVPPAGIRIGSSGFRQRSASPYERNGRSGWKLLFSGEPSGALTVEVTVTLAESSPLAEWRIAVNNNSDNELQQVIFPQINGIGSSHPGAAANDYLALPIYSGQRCPGPRERNVAALGMTEYPGSGMSIQLLTYCDDAGGSLYYASHDSADYRKSFETVAAGDKESFAVHLVNYADIPAAPGRWELPYPVMVGPVAGDWYDTAKLYRAWAVEQPRWKRSLADRTDIPPWFREIPVWFQGNEWSADAAALGAFADRIIAVREKLGFPIGFHWYIWQRYLAHDYNYPEYLPARPGFAEAVAKVQAAGVRVMPYLNIHLCETQLPMWDELHLADAAKRDSRGQFNRGYGVGGAYGAVTDLSAPVDVFRGDQSGRDMVPMCLTEPVWRDLMVEIARELLETYHVDAIYYDETYVFPGLCYARNHRHRWLGGTHHADSVTDIHRRTGTLRPEGVPTTGENLGECYIDTCCALINAHSDMRGDSLPIFQTVYSDRTTEIGLFVNQAEWPSKEVFASKLAFMLLRGRQLGWFNSDQRLLDLALPENADLMALLRQYCDVRLAALDYLYAGEMLRAPDLSAAEKVARTWEIWPTFQDKAEYEFPVVNAAVYRAPDHSLGLILANLTNREQTIDIPWNAEDWGLAAGTPVDSRIYASGSWQTLPWTEIPEKLTVSLPAWQPAVIALIPSE